MNPRVSIQGQEGSFHHQAAKLYFDEPIQPVACNSFGELVNKAEEKSTSDYGVLAIENSIAGSILNNYALLQKSNLKIYGEIYLTIKQHLLVVPGVSIEDIQEVHSHPMALLQCADFLDLRPQWKLVESQDTAYSAEYIHRHQKRNIAAIAGELAASLFNLQILASDIHSAKKNYTRFLVLGSASENIPEDANKASVYFQLEHHKGSLAAILIRLTTAGINLSKLQSVPIPGTEWEYGFHADLEFSDIDQYKEIMLALPYMTRSFRVFGIYKKGKTI